MRQALRVTNWLKCLLEGRQTLEGPPAELDVDQIEAAYFGIGNVAQRKGA